MSGGRGPSAATAEDLPTKGHEGNTKKTKAKTSNHRGTEAASNFRLPVPSNPF